MKRRATGFTMVEMLAVVVILAILAAIAAPNLGMMVRTQRVKSASFDLMASLILARSEAVKRNVAVTITPATGGWANGWSIADANGNALRTKSAMSNISISGPTTVTYSGNGRLSPVGSAPQFGISASDVTAANQFCVKVSSSGAPFSLQGTCS
jgi:type IV fimbrial biogenesis protein FimT